MEGSTRDKASATTFSRPDSCRRRSDIFRLKKARG
ncbi:hypothetical protein OROGR_016888 [Orobanche gracilis]